MLGPTADFDSSFTFYYDETNNIRKFYVREFDFNESFNSNFVLGGLVYEGSQPDIKPLFDRLNLQNNIKDVKFKHISQGKKEFLDCLKSEKLNVFLKYLLSDNDLYIHYSSLNILYWSIVDIVDSAIAVSSEVTKQFGLYYHNFLKNDLYKLAKLEIESFQELFYNFDYPNIKKESVSEFIEELTSIFDEYIDTPEFHLGLESLRQILKEANKKDSLPFIMDEEDRVLINNFLEFYLRPIYLFNNSNHIFDNEATISEMLVNYKIIDEGKEIKNYAFVDSQGDLFVQASDVFVGLMGKFTNYINTNSRDKIISDFDSLSEKQSNNIDSLINLLDKSHNKNIGFLHWIDSYEEQTKINLICEIRRNHA
ncbi:MAG: hypothetical protein F6K25_02365 [Okeania sp. SIO2G4]|nr:hypothetical protein [Okeania sp. SIO2G5]NEP91644.1 hypothetical protein [Okeania sp. SIO2F5]NEQ89646.1 hypothetical protein [Okeania sp. SIO2G4]